MSKELEALVKYIKLETEYIGNDTYKLYIKKNTMEDLEQALQRLEQIDNAKPSEALECLERMIRDFNETTTGMNGLGEIVVGNELLYFHKKELDTIEQALLKAQENSKYKQLEEQIGCPLEARCKVVSDSYVYDEDGCAYTEIIIYKDYILAYDGSEDVNGMLEPTKFYWKDYKKTWWLREDKNE